MDPVKNVCRLCGKDVRKSGCSAAKYRIFLQNVFDIDLCQDDPAIYPKVICSTCYSRISRYRNLATHAESRRSVREKFPTLYQFTRFSPGGDILAEASISDAPSTGNKETTSPIGCANKLDSPSKSPVLRMTMSAVHAEVSPIPIASTSSISIMETVDRTVMDIERQSKLQEIVKWKNILLKKSENLQTKCSSRHSPDLQKRIDLLQNFIKLLSNADVLNDHLIEYLPHKLSVIFGTDSKGEKLSTSVQSVEEQHISLNSPNTEIKRINDGNTLIQRLTSRLTINIEPADWNLEHGTPDYQNGPKISISAPFVSHQPDSIGSLPVCTILEVSSLSNKQFNDSSTKNNSSWSVLTPQKTQSKTLYKPPLKDEILNNKPPKDMANQYHIDLDAIKKGVHLTSKQVELGLEQAEAVKISCKPWFMRNSVHDYMISMTNIGNKICPVCHYSSPSSRPCFMKHMLSHQQYICLICEKSYEDLETFCCHVARHTHEKLYYCLVCGYSKNYEIELLKHVKMHLRFTGDLYRGPDIRNDIPYGYVCRNCRILKLDLKTIQYHDITECKAGYHHIVLSLFSRKSAEVIEIERRLICPDYPENLMPIEDKPKIFKAKNLDGNQENSVKNTMMSMMLQQLNIHVIQPIATASQDDSFNCPDAEDGVIMSSKISMDIDKTSVSKRCNVAKKSTSKLSSLENFKADEIEKINELNIRKSAVISKLKIYSPSLKIYLPVTQLLHKSKCFSKKPKLILRKLKGL